ncbi:MAG: hypothetical protein WD294_04285 [Phycisphaeraceae bacterium]
MFVLERAFPDVIDEVEVVERYQAEGCTTEQAIRRLADLDEIPEADLKQVNDALNFKDKLASEPSETLWAEYRQGQLAKAQADDARRFFNSPDASADFQKWARMPLWTAEEATSLLLGKDPAIVNLESLQRTPEYSPFRKEYDELFDRIQRALAVERIKQPIKPVDLLNWAKETDVEYPKELDKLLRPDHREASYQELLDENAKLRRLVQELEPDPRSGSKRERTNLLRILVAVAKQKYQYNPYKNKNIAPARISADARMCCSEALGAEQILDKLKEATDLLAPQIRDELKKAAE